MTAKVRAPSPAAPTTEPGMSRRAPCGSALSGNDRGRQSDDDDGGAHVEPEDGPPGPDTDEGAADHRPQRKGETGDGGPGAECSRPLLPVRVDVTDDRERARFGCGGADCP